MSRNAHLVRGLGLFEAAALVVGTAIGTGVFLKSAIMAQEVGSPLLVLTAWVAAGLLSLFGALVYAELGSLFPEAGGEYVYLRKAYGDLPAFLYGWMRFWIGGPGSIAAYAVGTVSFIDGLVDLKNQTEKTVIAIAIIVVFTVLNCFNVAFGGKLQTFMTALKLVMIIGLAVATFIFTPSGSVQHLLVGASDSSVFSYGAFGAAMLAALWAYDGWNNLPMVAGEIENPQRNVPLSLSLGMLSVLLIYLGINFSYFYALPFSEVINANSTLFPDAAPIATKAADTFLENSGLKVLSFAFVFSALGAMNGSILSGARVPFAMAKDKLFFKFLAEVHPTSHVPVASVIAQGVVSCLLALSGTFDQLTDYVIFASWLFYALCTGALFIFRKKYASSHRPYKVIGYPWLPLIFLVFALVLIVNTLVTSPKESFIGLILILLGVPVYFGFKNKV
ncbi:MAG: APC family permease [Bacteriovoracia bacterium]